MQRTPMDDNWSQALSGTEENTRERDARERVTVFLLSYNHARFIGETIDCILNQSFEDFRLLIVDDRSTDTSWEIIEDYCRRDKRIEAYQNGSNEGARFYSRYVREIGTEYVAIAHSDDLWATDKLEKQYRYLEENPHVAACFTGVSFINEAGEVISDEDSGYGATFITDSLSRFELLNHFFWQGNCLCHPSAMLRRSACDEQVLAVYGLESLPDFCKWIRLACRADIHVLAERLTFFRLLSHEGNTSGENLTNLSLVVIEDFLMLDEFLAIGAEDFFKVFPEARALVFEDSRGFSLPDSSQNTRFLFARLCLQDKRFYYRQYGLWLLYRLLNDDCSKAELEELYGYTEASFNLDKQEAQLYAIAHPERFLQGDLWYTADADPGHEAKIHTASFVDDEGFSVMRFMLAGDAKGLKGIRFSPHMLSFDQYRLVSVKTDKGTVGFWRCNPAFCVDGWDLFYDYYPSYQIADIKEAQWIEISLFAKQVESAEMTAFLEERQRIAAEVDSRAWKALMVFRKAKDRLSGLFSRQS